MNCQSFENVVNDLVRNQIMEASLRDQATQHSGDCETCAARLRAEQRLTNNLKDLAAEIRTAYSGAPAAVEERLLAEFRNHNSAVRVARQINRRYWAYAGIAALFLIVAGIGAASLFDSTSPANPQTLAKQSSPAKVEITPQPVPASGNAVVVETPVALSPAKKSPIRNSNRRSVTTTNPQTVIAGNRDNEIATEFLPVGYSSTLSVQDGGHVVRVEMPRSAMARFGIPVNMDRYDERVKADILVGTDGLARAIRFVQ